MKAQEAGGCPASDSMNLGYGSSISIADSLPTDAGAADPGSSLGEPPRQASDAKSR